MSLSANLAAELALVKNGQCESQIEIFERHIEDAQALARAKETLANVIRLIQRRELPGVVKPGSMSKAIGRKYGGWQAFCRLAKGAEPPPPVGMGQPVVQEPQVQRRSAGILDERTSKGGIDWGAAR